jgi:hypothetical protein
MVATTGQAYAYTGDDPVNDTDPSGEFSFGTILNVITYPGRKSLATTADFLSGVGNAFCGSSLVGLITGCHVSGPTSGYGKISYIVGEYAPYAPDPEDDGAAAAGSISKAESPIWQDLKPFRGSTRTNGLGGSARQYYEWDYTHNDIEVYNRQGQHLGSMDPSSGEMIKPAVAGRKIKI